MARFVSKRDIAPFLAFGTPRRLSSADKRLLNRLQWKLSDNYTVPSSRAYPSMDEMTPREIKLFACCWLMFSVFFSSAVPVFYYAPKRNIGDWTLFGIATLFVVALWVASVVYWVWAYRRLRLLHKDKESS